MSLQQGTLVSGNNKKLTIPQSMIEGQPGFKLIVLNTVQVFTTYISPDQGSKSTQFQKR